MNEAKFKVGDKVTPRSNQIGFTAGRAYAVTCVRLSCGGSHYQIHLAADDHGDTDRYRAECEFERIAAPTTKVRILERGKLLDTEFDTPVAAGDWLRDNGIAGEFELVRVESLGKVRAVIKLEDA
jgi:hypothetical protein